MSTKKNGEYTSKSTKASSHKSTKSTSKHREDSTDRKTVKKLEDQVKTKPSVSNIKQTNVESSRVTPITNKVPTSTVKKPYDSNSKKRSKQETPGTPMSKRVSRTQFFPSKSMYSNALKTAEATKTKTVDVDDKKTGKNLLSSRKTEDKHIPNSLVQTAKPKLVKTTVQKPLKHVNLKEKRSQVLNESPRVNTTSKKTNNIADTSDSSIVSERPKTATLRKGSIVNDNIVGPDVPKQVKPHTSKDIIVNKPPITKSDTSDEYEYEDDFDSYESDFEKYSSSNLDDISGEETSSISSSEASAPQILKSSVKRVNSAGTDDERKFDSGHFDMVDFKHKQMLDHIKESVEKENAKLNERVNPASLSDEGFEDQKSLQFINFLDAKKKCEHLKIMEMKRKRGREILSMINLDTYSFTLFDLPPVPYDIFIKTYGQTNTIQSSTQTGDDDVCEEVQTDAIINVTKWTQYPISFSKIDTDDPNYWNIYKSDYLGVGSEQILDEDKNNFHKSYNKSLLNKYVLSASELILRILAENNIGNVKLTKNSKDIPFSAGYIQMNTKINDLTDSSVSCVSFCCDKRNRFLSVHAKISDVDGGKSTIAIWNLNNLEEPEDILISYGLISCCIFGLSSNFIFAGLYDGTISIWNSEKSFQSSDETKKIPKYSTDIGFSHQNKVVGLRIVHFESEESFLKQATNEICSLDEDGELILWSVIIKQNLDTSTNNTSYDQVVLAKNSTVHLKEIHPELSDLQCTDFIMSAINNNYVFISTNYGIVIHHLIKGGGSNVKKFQPDTTFVTNCLESCPFSSDYFVAGNTDGTINLYSRLVTKPLIVFSDKESTADTCGIEMIQWSKTKPFVMYTKDVGNRIHIWDLNESDMSPTYSIPFEKRVTCLKLSPENNEEKVAYLLIGTQCGDIYLHQLNEDYGRQPRDIYERHVKTFLNYVNRL